MQRLLSALALMLAFISLAAVGNEAPDCRQAKAKPSQLWPVNHQMTPVSITGVTDPDRDRVKIRVMCISQNEPLDDIGDGHPSHHHDHWHSHKSGYNKSGSILKNSSYADNGRCDRDGHHGGSDFEPDADGIGSSTAYLRAERQGTGNGRVYHINFSATDTYGASCTGSVKVAVPHNKNSTAIDDGRLYSSALFATECASQPQNRPPEITSAPLTQVNENTLYVYDVEATDPEGQTIEWSLGAAPTGMTIDPASGVINWQTTDSNVGEHAVVVRVQDSYGALAEQSFQITVMNLNHPPVIVSAPETAALVERPYEYAVMATEPDADALGYQLVNAPEGMAINPATGLIQWVPAPTQTGSHSVTVRVTDIYQDSHQQSYTVFVSTGFAGNNHPPVINSEPVTSALQGQAYHYAVTASDEDNDAISYSLGSAPDGMSINAESGLIEWVPLADQGGEQRVVVVATDARSASDVQTYYINVDVLNNEPPHFISVPETFAVPLSIYVYAAQAQDPENDIIAYSLVTAPDGMSINADTGMIFWIPSEADAGQVISVEVMAKDVKGAQAIQPFAITVSGVVDNQAPAFITAAVTSVISDVLYAYDSEAADADINDSLTYSMLVAPQEASINATNGDIAWAPHATWEITRTGIKQSCHIMNNGERVPSPDVMITRMAFTADNKLAITVKNRGAADVINPLQVEAYQRSESANDNASDIHLGASSIAGLLVGEEQAIIIDVDSVSLNETVYATVNAEGVQECDLENNHAQAPVFAIQVADRGGLVDTQRYLLNVHSRNHRPYFAPVEDQAMAFVGIKFSYTPNAFDADKGDGLIFRLVGSIPAGLSINKYSGHLYWVPELSQEGEHLIAIEVIDTEGDVGSFALKITVDNNLPPEIVSSYPRTLNEGDVYVYAAEVVDPDIGDSQLWSLISPEGFLIDSKSGVVNSAYIDRYTLSVEENDPYCVRASTMIDGAGTRIKWEWSEHAYVYGPIMVGQVTDDNNDGLINELDKTDLIFTAGSNSSSNTHRLYAVDGETGKTVWKQTGYSPSSRGSPAIADLDGDGIIEIVAYGNDKSIMVFEHTGKLKWKRLITGMSIWDRHAPTIADLNKDG